MACALLFVERRRGGRCDRYGVARRDSTRRGHSARLLFVVNMPCEARRKGSLAMHQAAPWLEEDRETDANLRCRPRLPVFLWQVFACLAVIGVCVRPSVYAGAEESEPAQLATSHLSQFITRTGPGAV